MSGATGRSAAGGTRRLGDFVLLEELGRGGMGIVYRARQEALGRIVALKVLPSFAGLDRDAVARFRREAESAARIAHPGIVPVFAVGEDEGTHYYAMELVDGPPLDAVLGELIGRNPSRLLETLAQETSLGERCPAFRDVHWPAALRGVRYPVSCAAVALELANALRVAHRAGIIHRDLKPSNILLASAGRPRIVDFGLARDQTAVGLTRSGDAVGTPSYMAPEQAYGAKDLDVRVDVYGLGATLYEMLALRPPFEGAHAGEIMRKIVEEEPPALRALNARVPRDLATIVHKCLAKDRDARYPAMDGVEHDLRAFLRGESIAAVAPSLWRRAAGWGVRHRRGIAASAATTCVLATAGVVMGVMSSSRAREDGIAQLGFARTALVQDANLEAAQECYGRANELLDDAAVVEAARLEHVAAAFEVWYGTPERRPWLARLLAAVPADRRTPQWQALQRRLEGEATCRLEGHLFDAETSTSLRRFDGERFAEVATGWPADGRLRSGHYLVHVERIGLAPATTAFTVGRDREHAVPVPQVHVADLDEDDVLVASAEPPRAFALARTEMSGSEFARLLAKLEPEQRAELVSVETDGDDRPVRNLSFRQARALAALAGGHLPSRDEFVLAASGGAPVQVMPFPWGRTFDERLVAADPVRGSRPDPVGARAAGASPYGVLQLAGNVAEILAAGSDGVGWLAGGDWLAGREQVRVDAAEPIAALDQPQRRAGVRVARFVHPPREVDAANAAEATAKMDALWSAGSAVLLTDWTLDETGSARVRLRLAGLLPEGGRPLEIPLATPGFLHARDVQYRMGGGEPRTLRVRAAADGRARADQAELERAVDGESSSLRLPTAGLAARQLFRVQIDAALAPVSGVTGRADGYVLQVPIKATGTLPTCYRVTLPRGCHVDEVDPPPSRSYVVNGQPSLVWEFEADGRGERTFSGVVRFRKDGWLTPRWPTKAEAMAVVGELFAALQARDGAALQRLLAPTFLLLPSGLTAARLAGGAHAAHEWFDDVRFVDVTAVGAVRTAELLVDWHVRDAAGARHADAWPLRVHWTHEDGRARVLQVSPSTRGDSGRIESGVYVQDRLLVRIEPDERFTLSRTAGHLAPMQVELRPVPRAPFFAMVLGLFEETDADEGAVWQRLTDGFHVTGGDKRCLEQAPATLGPHPAQREEWLFAAGPGFTRERWLKVSLGRRRLLVRLGAVGVSRDGTDAETAAATEFSRAEAWFTHLLRHLHLD